MTPTTADSKVMTAHRAHILLLYTLMLVLLLIGLSLWGTVKDNQRAADAEAELAKISRDISRARDEVLLSATRANCEELNGFKGGLATIIRRSQKSLAGNEYYQQHPEELARAQQQNRDILRVLKRRDCR